MSWIDLYGGLVAQAAGGGVPLTMLLGHIQTESGGNPNDRTKLDERGLMQIHPGTSKEMGFDHDRMFDPAYSITAGVEMFRRMADRMRKEFGSWLPADGDFFWHLVRFEFAIGSGATRKILAAMDTDGIRPGSWSEFTAYLTQNRDRLFKLTKHDPVKWSSSVDRVFAIGEKLLGVVAPGGTKTVAIVAGCAAAALLIVLWVSLREKS